MRTTAPLLASVVLVSLVVGCRSTKTRARDEFAAKHGCPEADIQVKPRPDVSWAALHPAPAGEPADKVAQRNAALAKVEAFEVTGCGHSNLIGCWDSAGTSETNNASKSGSCVVYAGAVP